MSGKDGGGWILPDVINPPERVCVQIEIPNEKNHITAFWGALYELTYWNNWQRDPDKLGTEVAAVWKSIWLEAIQTNNYFEGCPMPFDVRQNEESPCTLEKTVDGIIWTPWANLRLCAGKQGRYNPETGEWESSTDGGETWTPDPENNPLNQGNYRRDPLTGPNAKCDAAYNTRVYLSGLVDTIQAGIDATSALASIAGVIAGAIGLVTGGAALPGAFLLEGIAGVFYAGSSAISAAFTNDFYEDMQCIFYCESDSDGQFDAEGWQSVIDQLNAIGGLAGTFMAIAVQVAGADGLSNMGTVSAGASGDCSDCECGWCYEFDFAVSNGGWVSQPDILPGYTRAAASYSGGGWNATYSERFTGVPYADIAGRIRKEFPVPGYVTNVTLIFDHNPVSGTEWKTGFDTTGAGIFVVGSSANGSNLSYTAPINAEISALSAWVCVVGNELASSPVVGSGRIKKVIIRGTGDNPFGESNC